MIKSLWICEMDMCLWYIFMCKVYKDLCTHVVLLLSKSILSLAQSICDCECIVLDTAFSLCSIPLCFSYFLLSKWNAHSSIYFSFSEYLKWGAVEKDLWKGYSICDTFWGKVYSFHRFYSFYSDDCTEIFTLFVLGCKLKIHREM